jgi:hypothetical protein
MSRMNEIDATMTAGSAVTREKVPSFSTSGGWVKHPRIAVRCSSVSRKTAKPSQLHAESQWVLIARTESISSICVYAAGVSDTAVMIPVSIMAAPSIPVVAGGLSAERARR